MSDNSLHERLGGYDAIAAVVNAFLPRVTSDQKLRRFWDREKGEVLGFIASLKGDIVEAT